MLQAMLKRTIDDACTIDAVQPYFLDIGYTSAHLCGNYGGLINLVQRTQSSPGEQVCRYFPGVQGFTADGVTLPNPAYGAWTWQTPRTTMVILRYRFH